MSCVYKHTFPNGAVYIGRTNQAPEDRWLDGWGYRNSPLMFKAILKFGWDNIQHEIIEDGLTTEESELLERELIEEYSNMVECVYNVEKIPPEKRIENDKHYLTKESILKNKQSKTKPKVHRQRRNITTETHPLITKIPIIEKPPHLHSCPVAVYNLDCEYLTTYPSGAIAADELGVSACDISACCRGVKAGSQPRYQVKGYVFRYAPPSNSINETA